MNEFIESLRKQQSEKAEEERAGFWKNHSVFEASYRTVAFKGTAEALVLLFLYQRAGTVPFRVAVQTVIRVKVRIEKICECTGLVPRSVSQAIKTLEAAGCIVVENRDSRSKLDGHKLIHVYLLLHPETRTPLTARPGEYGICFTNGFERPYITAPSETLEVLKKMRPAGRAVYITALSLASKEMQTKISVTRARFLETSLLGRNAFNRGLRDCQKNRLFAYERSILTVHDPLTGRPSVREKRGWVYHENPNWALLDFNSLTGAQWQQVIQRILKREFNVSSDGWTYSRGSRCPFCKEEHSLSLNFQKSLFECHNTACTFPRGRLAPFVKRVLGVRHMRAVKQFILDCLKDVDQKQATA